MLNIYHHLYVAKCNVPNLYVDWLFIVIDGGLQTLQVK